MIRKKLIFINGVMGVGKTTISKELFQNLNNSFWVDGDNLWMMNPLIVNNENKKMIISNIHFILNSFISNSSSEYIIFSWVIHTEEIFTNIIEGLNIKYVDIYKITLICTEKELIARLNKDISLNLRSKDSFDKCLSYLPLYEKMNTYKINTTNRSISSIVNEIKTFISVK